jgi:hypothetical protein
MKKLKNDRYVTASAWLVLGVVARLIPHPPNMSPMDSISLFGGSRLGRKAAFLLTFGTLILSDVALAWMSGRPVFGLWTLFTYSGFAAILLAGSRLRANASAFRTLGFLLGSGLGFWLWTNFGLWATGEFGMYPHTLSGLLACYGAALPFLANSLAGDVLWGFAFFFGFQGLQRLAPRFGWSLQSA